MAITIKSAREIEIMRRSGAILAEVQDLLQDAIKPGITTNALDRMAHKLIEARGARPSFLGHMGFPKSICTSVDYEVVHGIPNDIPLVRGEIVSIDVGVYLEGYHTDGAFTLGVGDIDDEVTLLIGATKAAFIAGAQAALAGKRVGDISAAVEAVARTLDLGNVTELTGHGVGRQLWEDPQVPNAGIAGTGPLLRRGMTIAIEPMFTLGDPETYVYDDGWTVATVDLEPAAHYEHTILITDGVAEILTIRGENVL